MAEQLWMTIRYLISGEDSRVGRTEYWNDVFLARKSPVQRKMLEVTKVFFLLGFAFCMAKAVSLI